MPTDDAFDHYHIWLGIPPDEQPPTHYRLLGLRIFESDPRVIINASDRQMAHVRSFQHGPFSALSQRLLNEIATARICLLNQDSKREYDQRLRSLAPPIDSPIERATPSAKPLPRASVPQTDHPVRSQVGPGAMSSIKLSRSTRALPSRPKKSFRRQTVVSIALAILFVVLCTVYLTRPTQQSAHVPETKPAAATLKTPQPARPLNKQTVPVGESIVRISSESGAGTGVIVEPGGLVLTAYDQAAGRSMLRVKSQIGTDYEVAGVVAADRDRGLVLLRVPNLAAFKRIELANRLPMQGEVATLVDRSNLMHSTSMQVTTAIRSARDANFPGLVFQKQGFAKDLTWLQILGATPAIKSGAALIDTNGKLTGLHLFSDNPSQSLHLAVSSDSIRKFLSSADRRLLVSPSSLPVRSINLPIAKAWSPATALPPQTLDDEPAGKPKSHSSGAGDRSQADLGTWVDLLEHYDPQQPGQIGVWQLLGDRLALVQSSGKASTNIASSLKDSFDLALDFSFSSTDLRLTLFFPNGSGQCMLDLVSVGNSPMIALASTKNDRRIAAAEALPRKLLPNRPHQLLLSMRVNGEQLIINTMLDAAPGLHWEGPASKVAVLDRSSGNSDSIGVAVGNAKIHVHEARLRRTSPGEPSLKSAPDGMWSRQDILRKVKLGSDNAESSAPNGRRVIAIYKHIVPGRGEPRLSFLSDGTIQGRNSTWRLNGKTLILDWSDPNDAAWHDELRISDDGLSYYGKNQGGVVIRGDAIELSREWHELIDRPR